MSDLSLVVGGDGLLGRAVVERLRAQGSPVLATTRRPGPLAEGRLFLDLTDLSPWSPPPDVAVAYLCAAATSLHRCRQDPAGTWQINVEAQWALAEGLLQRGAFVVYTSSNLVFDGSAPFRRAQDPVCPLTEYGRQKAEMERRLLASGPRAAVVRLTKVIDPGWSLLREWAAALRRREAIHPFTDMVLPPVPVGFVADALCRVGERRAAGIVQISGPQDVPYPQMARRLAELMRVDPALVQPLPSAESGLVLEAAPRYATLDTTRLREELGLEPPPVGETLDAVLAAVAASA